MTAKRLLVLKGISCFSPFLKEEWNPIADVV